MGHWGLELLGRSTNSSMLALQTSAKRVHGFAAMDKATGTVQAFALNNYETSQDVHIALPSGFPQLSHAESMVDTDDHWGTVKETDLKCDTPGSCEATLPPLSFTVLTSAT